MKRYKTRIEPFSGSNYAEIKSHAALFYNRIKKKTKRRPYVRSAYFSKQKIFLPLFWNHVHEKLNHRDKTRRLKYFPCAIDLIEQSRYDPESKESVDNKKEVLHRFIGETKDGVIFFVQIKEHKRTGEKWLMSVFPE